MPARHRSDRIGRRAFTLLELLVVISIVALLLAILLPVLSHARAAARSTACVSNLRQIAIGFTAYAAENRGVLPSEDTELPWDELIADAVDSVDVFVCPADADGLAMELGLSYAWRDAFEAGIPAASLEGKRLDAVKRTDVALTFEDGDGRHADGVTNAASVDTSARTYRAAELEADLHIAVQ